MASPDANDRIDLWIKGNIAVEYLNRGTGLDAVAPAGKGLFQYAAEGAMPAIGRGKVLAIQDAVTLGASILDSEFELPA